MPTEVAVSWLTFAYGEDKAAEILSLPYEMQMQLVFGVLRYGPVGEEVMALLIAVGNAPFELVKDDLIYLSQMGGVVIPMQYSNMEVMSPPFSHEWAYVERHLRESHHVAIPDEVDSYSTVFWARTGLRCLAWLMSSSYEGFEGAIPDIRQEYVNTGNELLDKLGLPAMGTTKVAGEV